MNIWKLWQQYWDIDTKGRHLYHIQSTVDRGRVSGWSRTEENMITRLRLGHTRLNSTMHLISKHPTGLCEVCDVNETVEHVIMYCRKYTVERNELKDELENKGERFIIKNVLNPGRNMKSVLLQYLGRTGLNKKV